MSITRTRSIIKLSQDKRKQIFDMLNEIKIIPKEFKIGSQISYEYRYDGVKMAGISTIIGKRKHQCFQKIVLLTKDKAIVTFVYNPDKISLKLIKDSKRKIKRAKLNYLIKK